MEQNYNLLAQSRANYYTQGSPVQFVRVELLQGDMSGEIAVCLTFKNIEAEPITGLVIRFKCKNTSGQLLCEDQFYYEGINAGQGELFGSDDAVYISSESIGSVEVELDRAFLKDGSAHSLTGYRRIKLPAPRPLPAKLAQQLEARTGKMNLKMTPQVIDEGWYCACGAFHPNEENTVYCSECGSDRILLQKVLTSLIQGGRPMQQPEGPAQATTVQGGTRLMTDQERFASEYHQARGQADEQGADSIEEKTQSVEWTQSYDRKAAQRSYREVVAEPPVDDGSYDSSDYDMLDDDYDGNEPEPEYSGRAGRYAEETDGTFDDEMAEKIIRFAPPVTAVLCACVVAVGVIMYFLAK